MNGLGLISYHSFWTASYLLLVAVFHKAEKLTISMGSAVVAAAPAIRTTAVCSLMLN